MPPETDRITLWRELRSWPRPVQLGFGALAVLVFASMFAIGPLYAPDFPDESAWPAGEIPDSIALDAVDGPAGGSDATLPEGVAVYGGDPLWTASVAEGEQLARVEEGVLRLAEGRIALEKDGATVWTREWASIAPEIGVAGGVVVLAEAVGDFDDEDYEWPGRQDTVALDLGTGEEVWRDREASFVSVFADAVVMTECTGEQEGRVGDCTLAVRDPEDHAVRWSTPTYASAQVAAATDWIGEPMPDRLLVESYPTGHESRTVEVYEDGELLGGVATLATATLAGDTLIVADDYDANPADGCTAALAGYRLGESEPAWEVAAMTRKAADLVSCGGLPTTEAREGMLPLTIDGVPSIVDAATGEAVWEAPAEGQALALGPDARVLVTAGWEAGASDLVAYDAAAGAELWRAGADVESRDRAWAVGSTLWLHGDPSMWGWSSFDVYAYDLATGEGVALPGAVAYFAPGQVVMSRGEDASVLTAWPTELW